MKAFRTTNFQVYFWHFKSKLRSAPLDVIDLFCIHVYIATVMLITTLHLRASPPSYEQKLNVKDNFDRHLSQSYETAGVTTAHRGCLACGNHKV